MSTRSEVEKTAELAKLQFDEEAMEHFIPTFQQILEYFEQLEEVDTSEVEPTYHAVFGQSLETPLRQDECEESFEQDLALREAPKTKDGHFRVPKVIE